MRRRQQDHLPPNPPHGHKNAQDATPLNSRSRLRGQRSNAFIIITVVLGIVVLLVVWGALRNKLGIVVAVKSSSLHEETASLRGGNGGVIKTQRRRIIAIGDIHGDKDALVRALQLANLVDQEEINGGGGTTWIGGSDTVVQIGDLLNKAEPRDEDTLSYIVQIEQQARAAGGEVVVTVGDHDLHNAPKLWQEMKQLRNDRFPSWMHAAFIVDGHTLFVHGSLSKTAFDSAGGSLEGMNRAAEAWLAGKGEKPKWIGRGDGPIWSRLYSDKASDERPNCDELSQLLNELSVDRMVVGHTVRREGISSICNGKVWRIDVGLSKTETRAGKIGASEVLELLSYGGGDIVTTILSTDAKLKSWKQ